MLPGELASAWSWNNHYYYGRWYHPHHYWHYANAEDDANIDDLSSSISDSISDSISSSDDDLYMASAHKNGDKKGRSTGGKAPRYDDYHGNKKKYEEDMKKWKNDKKKHYKAVAVDEDFDDYDSSESDDDDYDSSGDYYGAHNGGKWKKDKSKDKEHRDSGWKKDKHGW